MGDTMKKCIDCGEKAVTELDKMTFCAECAEEYTEEN